MQATGEVWVASLQLDPALSFETLHGLTLCWISFTTISPSLQIYQGARGKYRNPHQIRVIIKRTGVDAKETTAMLLKDLRNFVFIFQVKKLKCRHAKVPYGHSHSKSLDPNQYASVLELQPHWLSFCCFRTLLVFLPQSLCLCWLRHLEHSSFPTPFT